MDASVSEMAIKNWRFFKAVRWVSGKNPWKKKLIFSEVAGLGLSGLQLY